VGDRARVAGHPAQQGVAVVQAEQAGHRGSLLGHQPVHPSAGGGVQGIAGVEQPQVGRAYGRAQGVRRAGVRDAPQHPDVAQPAAGLLQVALQQEGQFAVGAPAALAGVVQPGKLPHGGTPPLVPRGGGQGGGQVGITGDVPGVEQAEGDLHVVVRGRQRLRDGAHRVVEADLGVPHRVPDRGRERVHARDAGVQQDQVEVAVRGALAPAEPAHRDQRHAAALAREQGGQPGIERRRTLVACGGADPPRPRVVAGRRWPRSRGRAAGRWRFGAGGAGAGRRPRDRVRHLSP
jgi:hypothetical protein